MCTTGQTRLVWEAASPPVPDAVRTVASAVWQQAASTFQHELRNPLQTIQGAAEVLRPHVSPAGRRALSIIEQQVRIASEYLMDQLEPPVPALLGTGRLSEVVRVEIERAALRACTRRLTFGHRPPREEPEVRLHRGSMARVMANLFRNSAQARPDAHVTIRYKMIEGHVECLVADNGPGFPNDMLADSGLAQPEDGAHHMGLSLAAATVRAHGGTIQIGNRRIGATVKLRLPLTDAGGSAEVAAAAAPGSETWPANDATVQ